MKRMLFNATYQEELRVATVEGQKLINFDIETSSKTQRRGNIYKGVITRVEQSLEACFVDYGVEKQGFLPFKDIDSSCLPDDGKFRDMSKLKDGMELIVQVEKDERGNKGAALTTFISLPGRYLVLMPNNSRSGGISRRIDGDERDELKNALSQVTVPNGMSVIARTAALGRGQEELQWDLDYLCNLWGAITTAASNHKGSFLIYQESSLVIRSIRDHFSPDISEVLIDMEDIFDQAKQFMAHVMPNYVNRVKLYHDDVPLFSRFQIEHQIESAYGRTINLPSGGSIVIDHTEALTAIDVNSARSNKGSDIEATALTTNLEAAEEVSRQLRLRDLGGLVVVDFIDMESSRNQREVENYFRQQLGLDRARIQMGKLSRFGLLELSRQRLQASLEESTTIPCPRCSGIGAIRGIESTAIHVMRIIQEEAIKNNSVLSALHVQLPVAVATYLLNEKKDDITKIEQRMKIKVILIPNIHMESPQYKVKKITHDNYETILGKASYDLAETPEESIPAYQNSKPRNANEPKAMVKNITPTAPAPIKSNVNSFISTISKLIKTIFGGDNNKSTNTKSTKNVNQTRSGRNQPRNGNTLQKPRNPNHSINRQTRTPNNKPANTRNNNRPNQPVMSDATSGNPNRPSNQRNNRQPQLGNTRPNDLQNNKPQSNFEVVNSSNNQPVMNQKPTQNQSGIGNNSIKPNSISSTTVVKDPDIALKTKIEDNPQSNKKRLVVNTITQPVDLGSLQMVGTDNNISVKAPIANHNIDNNLKRFNDQVIDKAPVKATTDYQQVETNNS